MNTPRWYMLNKMGMATLCTNKADAQQEAADAQRFWPHMGPHRAVQLVEVADVEALRTGYAAARLEIESLQARIKTMAEEHADELMLAHLDGRMLGRSTEPAGAQPTTQTAPQQEVQEPGWVLVPAEATDAMMAAFAKAADADVDWHNATESDRQDVRDGFCPAYRAMLRAAPQPSPTPQADSQPAQVEVADAVADSQYLAGVSAGWNAANADNPNEALRKLHESRAGYLKPLHAARAPADSVTEDAALLKEARDALWQPANVALCERIDAYLDAARKQGANHD